MGQMTPNGVLPKMHNRFCKERQSACPSVSTDEWVCDCPALDILAFPGVVPPSDYSLKGIFCVTASADIVIGEKDGSWAVWTRNRHMGHYSNGSYWAKVHFGPMAEKHAKREFSIRLGIE